MNEQLNERTDRATIYNLERNTLNMAIQCLQGEGFNELAEEIIYKSSNYYCEKPKQEILEDYNRSDLGIYGDY